MNEKSFGTAFLILLSLEPSISQEAITSQMAMLCLNKNFFSPRSFQAEYPQRLQQEPSRNGFAYDDKKTVPLWTLQKEKNQGSGSLIGHHIREGFHELHESFQNFLSYRIFLQISTSILSDDADRRKFSSETVKTCRALPSWYDKIFFRNFL